MSLNGESHDTTGEDIAADPSVTATADRVQREGRLDELLTRGPLDVDRVISISREVLAALSRVHRSGSLHLSVRPRQIIVRGREAMLGPARLPAGDGRSDDVTADELRFMAPEQTGLIDHPLGPAADLFALGHVLYACLAGRPACGGGSPRQVLQQHVKAPPGSLRRKGIAIPRALDEVLERLMRTDPNERYQSVDAVEFDLVAIAEAREQGVADPPLVIGRQDLRRFVTTPGLVGREPELLTLERQLRAAAAGEGGLVLLEGEAGTGKSWLLDELHARAAARGFSVSRGRGVEQSAVVPLQLLQGVTRSLASGADRVEGLRRRLGDAADWLGAALPQFTIGEDSTVASVGAEERGEERTVAALAQLLDALGSAERPALIVLDDCQWADHLSTQVLARWHEREVSLRHVLVVVALRSEDVPRDHRLRRLRSVARLHLAPFDRTRVRALLSSSAGPLPDEAVHLAYELSGGNPLMAVAALEGMVESDVLVASESGWRFEPPRWERPQADVGTAAMLHRRVDALSIAARELLLVGAVLGKEFEIADAGALWSRDVGELDRAVEEARRRHFVWSDIDSRRCAFVHDRLRELFLERLGPAERAALHLRAATRIERLGPDRVFELAYHFDMAGAAERALPYAVEAARRARARYALELAERMYRIAERAPTDAASAAEISEELAYVLYLRGRLEEAGQLLERLLEAPEDDIVAARIEGKLGELAFRAGDAREALRANVRALRRLGRRAPANRRLLPLARQWEALVQALHVAMPSWPGHRRAHDTQGDDLLEASLCSYLHEGCVFTGDLTLLAWCGLRGLNLLERYPAGPPLVRALGNHAFALCAGGRFDRAARYAKRALLTAHRCDDRLEEARALFVRGITLRVAGRFDEAERVLGESERLWRQVGDAWFEHACRFHALCAVFSLGRLGEVIQAAEELSCVTEEMRLSHLPAYAAQLWAQAQGGGVPADRIEAVLRLSHDSASRAVAEVARGINLLADERSAEAVTVFRTVVEETKPTAALFHDAHNWLSTATRLEAASLRCHRARRSTLREALAAARQAVRQGRRFPYKLPHALRELGLAHAMWGHQARARRALDRSLAVAARQKARHEHAQSLLARAQVGLELGWPGATDDLAAAGLALDAMGARMALGVPRVVREPDPPSLIVRFEALMEVGRQLACALRPSAVYRAVHEASASLLRAESSSVVEVLGSDHYRLVAGDHLAPGPRPLLARAIADQQPVTKVAANRVILCAPIFAAGRAVAGFMARRRLQIGGLRADEVQLAQYVAMLAGSALESTGSVDAIRALTKATEERQREIEALSEALARGQEEERRRIALTLHDAAEQSLVGLQIKLDDLGRQVPATSERIGELRTLADETLEELRRLAHGLRPAALDHLGLPDALADLCSSLTSDDLVVSFHVSPTNFPSLPRPMAEAGFRIAQAALNNVLVHARAVHAWVALDASADAVCLIVEDDGKGFDPTSGRVGLGLIGMRERAAWLGGTVEIQSAPGAGTRLVVKLPRSGKP